MMLMAQGCPTAAPMPETETDGMMMAEIEERMVNENGAQGLYVLPAKRDGALPGLLVIHEWWGLNDQIKDEARNLAREGYAVFAIDLYDGEVATESSRAGELAGAVRANPDEAEVKMKAALDFLEAQPEVNGEKLASMGWCFGGGMSGIIGSSGDDRLDATVIYYGNPVTDASRLANISQPVLGIWGVEDQSISVESVRAFESALESQGTPVEFHYYEGAGHVFANPTRGDAYKPEATEDAWEKTLAFLKEHLGM